VGLPGSSFAIVTWNLQGSRGVDAEGMSGVLDAVRPDVIALQEVERGQARRLAAALGDASMRWAFKHFSWRTWPEGLAVLTPHRLTSATPFVLRRGTWFSWRRRVGIDAVIERDGEAVGVVDVHLSPHEAAALRVGEVGRVRARLGGRALTPMLVGDFNELPGGPAAAALQAGGWLDAWTLAAGSDGGDGATNWTAGNRRGRPPTQRLDYVFVPPGWVVDEARVLADADRHDWFAERSDHLPLLVRCHRAETSS
jgi:endonuclease/exonuclease/phosphatase family metal-dependent hydrolase